MLAAAPYMIVFRIVHILAGIFWAGSVYMLVAFVQPSVAAIAPAGAPFMAELLGKRRLVDVLIALGSATVVGGLFLYLALVIGIFGTRPNVVRLLAMGRSVAGSAGPPSPELAAEIARTQDRLKIFARISFGLIVLAALAMALARYI